MKENRYCKNRTYRSAIITREPVKETKTEQILIMHEEIVIERRPTTNDLSLSSNNNSSKIYNENNESVKTKIQIKIPLKRKEV